MIKVIVSFKGDTPREIVEICGDNVNSGVEQ